MRLAARSFDFAQDDKENLIFSPVTSTRSERTLYFQNNCPKAYKTLRKQQHIKE